MQLLSCLFCDTHLLPSVVQKLRSVTLQVLEALTHLHSQGIVHKDLRVSGCGLRVSGCGLMVSGCGLRGSGCGERNALSMCGMCRCSQRKPLVSPSPLPPQPSLVFIDGAEVVKLTGYAILRRCRAREATKEYPQAPPSFTLSHAFLPSAVCQCVLVLLSPD